jgi:hypothetical protein
MANIEPRAACAAVRIVATVARFVRYMLTPVDAKMVGWVASKPAQ